MSFSESNLVMKLKIVNGKYHYIRHEFEDKNEYIISHNDKIYYWRPSLHSIHNDFEYVDIQMAQKIINGIKETKYRRQSVKENLLKHWNLVFQLMREETIEDVFKPEIDYNTYILAC